MNEYDARNLPESLRPFVRGHLTVPDVRAIAHEACRLQREADIEAGWIQYGEDIQTTPLVVPESE